MSDTTHDPHPEPCGCLMEVVGEIAAVVVHNSGKQPLDDPPCTSCRVRRSAHGHYWAAGHPYYPSPSVPAADDSGKEDR